MSMSVDEIQGLLESALDRAGIVARPRRRRTTPRPLTPDTTVRSTKSERESILGRGAQPDVRRWFEQWGIRDAVTPIRTPADLTAGVRARWCIPVRHRGELLGFVSAFDDGQVNDEALDGAMKTAEQLAAVLFRRRLAERTDAELVRHIIHRTGLSDDPTDAYPAAATSLSSSSASMRPSIRMVRCSPASPPQPDAPQTCLPRGTAPSGEIGGLIAALVPIPPSFGHTTRKAIRRGRAPDGIEKLAVLADLSRDQLRIGTASTATHRLRRSTTSAPRRPLRPRFSPIASWNDIGAVPHPRHDSADQQPRQRDRSTRSRAAPTVDSPGPPRNSSIAPATHKRQQST